jgi:hypothetical protein
MLCPEPRGRLSRPQLIDLPGGAAVASYYAGAEGEHEDDPSADAEQ